MPSISAAHPDEIRLHAAILRLAPHGLLTAFSGGVDSTLVAVCARRALGRARAVAAIGDSASLPRHELEEARALALQFDFELVEVAPGEQENPAYLRNAPDRCYHCKTHLYAALGPEAHRRGLAIANGTNLDDLSEIRPGLLAAQEAGVVSPLLEAGLGKARVRALAAALGLPNCDKPAAPCLASRLPWGTPVTPERLGRVERAEHGLRLLGFSDFRVRDHGEVARVELPPGQLADAVARREGVVAAVLAAGYKHATLDLSGLNPQRTVNMTVLR
jgi:uncharacterized protein